MSDEPPIAKYPLLEAMLAVKGMKLQATYRVRDIAELFGVKSRSIQDRIANGELCARDLPGHGRCLPEDLEAFLRNSSKKRRQNVAKK